MLQCCRTGLGRRDGGAPAFQTKDEILPSTFTDPLPTPPAAPPSPLQRSILVQNVALVPGSRALIRFLRLLPSRCKKCPCITFEHIEFTLYSWNSLHSSERAFVWISLQVVRWQGGSSYYRTLIGHSLKVTQRLQRGLSLSNPFFFPSPGLHKTSLCESGSLFSVQ